MPAPAPGPAPVQHTFSLHYVSDCTTHDTYTGMFELRVEYQLYEDWQPVSGDMAALGVNFISETYANPKGNFSDPGAWCRDGFSHSGCNYTPDDKLMPGGIFYDYLGGNGSLTQSFYLNGSGDPLLVVFSATWANTQLANVYNSSPGPGRKASITVGQGHATSVGAPPCGN
jgi:hypothetical protein